MKDENQDYELFLLPFLWQAYQHCLLFRCISFLKTCFSGPLLGHLHIQTCFCCHGNLPCKKPSAYEREALLALVKQSAWEKGHAPAISYLHLNIFPLIHKLLIWMILHFRLVKYQSFTFFSVLVFFFFLFSKVAHAFQDKTLLFS